MKNNKYAPYVLGPILLIVWGLVFYKIYQAVYGGGEVLNVPSFNTIPILEEQADEEGYVLLADYKDPFLGKHLKNTSSNVVSSRPRKRTVVAVPNQTPKAVVQPVIKKTSKAFPTILYQGFQVMDTDTIALLKINQRFYPAARRGEVLQGIELKAIFKDSIQLLYDGQNKTFGKGR